MHRHYRLTARSLPLKRRSRLFELPAEYPLTTAGLVLFASLTAFVWSLPYGSQSAATPTSAGDGLMSELNGGPGPERRDVADAANIVSPLPAPVEVGEETGAAASRHTAAAIDEVAPRELPDAAPVHTEVTAATEEHEAEVAEEVEERPPARYALAGTWAPKRAACDKRVAARTGWLPMRISERGARAGQTACSFHKLAGNGGGWTALAECRGPRGHWISNVRLSVAGSSLTWSSARGVRRYVRCDRVQVASR